MVNTRKELFMEQRELAMQRAQKRHQLRMEELDRMRNAEDATVIIAPGQGCGLCLVVGRSVPSADDPDDCCFKTYSYLPIHLDLDNQRPAWCAGFEAREIAHETHEVSTYAEATADRHETEHQEELPL